MLNRTPVALVLLLMIFVSCYSNPQYGYSSRNNATAKYRVTNAEAPRLIDESFVLSKEQWAETANRIFQIVGADYVYLGQKSIPFESIKADTMRRISSSRNSADSIQSLVRFFAQLKNMHSGLLNVKVYSANFSARLVEGRLVVVNSSNPLIPPKSEIVEIDGVSTVRWLTNRGELISASTDYSRFQRAISHVPKRYFFEPESRSFKLKSIEGIESEVTVVLCKEQDNALDKPVFSSKLGTIGYLVMNSVQPKVVSSFSEEFSRVADCSALIVDFRNNGGGDSPVSDFVLSHLIDKPTRIWGGNGILLPAKTKTFLGPVILLVGPNTASAAECFVFNFHDIGRGRILGQLTGGDSGSGPVSYTTEFGVSFRIATRTSRSLSGLPMEGKGCEPDIEIEQSYEDTIRGIDTVLESAKGLLLGSI